MPAWVNRPEGAKAGKVWPRAAHGGGGGGWHNAGSSLQTASTWMQVESWMCCTCGTFTWAPKKQCRKCGCKKSYAQTITKPEAPQTEWRWPSSQHSEASHDAPGSITEETDKKKHVVATEINNIEEALKHLPEDSESCKLARSDLLEKHRKLKTQSMRDRPLGTQLDGVQGAIDRAQKRLHEATVAAEVAQNAMAVEQACIAKYTAEKADIEAQIKQCNVFTTQDAPKTTELSDQLIALYKKMESKPGIAQDTLNAAKTQMESLLAGLQAVLVAEEAAATEVKLKQNGNLARQLASPERDAPAAKKSATEPWADADAAMHGDLEFPLDWTQSSAAHT